jgi:hypothetical protein
MLDNIFKFYGYAKNEASTAEVGVYLNEAMTQCYFVAQFDENDFIKYEEAAMTEKIVDLYSSFKDKQPSLARNSSLVVVVSCGSYQPSQDILNKIYAVEEDPFGMRKYVIAAHSETISQMAKIEYAELAEIVFNKSRFDLYKDRGLDNEDYQYMAAIQVFIKLPFLKITENESQFKTIAERISVLMEQGDNQLLRSQSLINNEVFKDREQFQANAISLNKNDLDEWLDLTLGVSR